MYKKQHFMNLTKKNSFYCFLQLNSILTTHYSNPNSQLPTQSPSHSSLVLAMHVHPYMSLSTFNLRQTAFTFHIQLFQLTTLLVIFE